MLSKKDITVWPRDPNAAARFRPQRPPRSIVLPGCASLRLLILLGSRRSHSTVLLSIVSFGHFFPRAPDRSRRCFRTAPGRVPSRRAARNPREIPSKLRSPASYGLLRAGTSRAKGGDQTSRRPCLASAFRVCSLQLERLPTRQWFQT